MIIVLVVLFVGIVVLPQIWVKHVLARHSEDRPDLPGTGAELARHLLNRFDLAGVKVEVTDRGDHYDPDAKAVRLSPAHHDGRSISAAAVAAHEVGHALQHAGGERSLEVRQNLARLAMWTDRAAGIFFFASPILGVVVRSPLAIFLMVGIGVALLSVRVITNLVTLPVEYDASFGKALPILEHGAYLPEDDLPAVRSVLRAAAFTSVAGALISLVNVARWIRLLR